MLRSAAKQAASHIFYYFDLYNISLVKLYKNYHSHLRILIIKDLNLNYYYLREIYIYINLALKSITLFKLLILGVRNFPLIRLIIFINVSNFTILYLQPLSYFDWYIYILRAELLKQILYVRKGVIWKVIAIEGAHNYFLVGGASIFLF